MLGWQAVLDGLAEFYEAEMPGKLVALRARLGVEGPLTEKDLKDFQLITTEERATLPLNRWPAMLIESIRKARVRGIDVAPGGGPIYTADYRVRVYLWVREAGYAPATQARNRLALAATELLFENLTLGIPGFRVDPFSLTEQPAETVQDRSKRSIAATYLEFDVTIEETVEVEGLGTVESGSVDVIPAHPALD